jgi:glycosyltransferase involved in cell wall biosynthesis
VVSRDTPRHCMVVHSYYPIGETRVQRQAAALTAAGVKVDVVCLRKQGEPAREEQDGVSVFRLPVGRHRGQGMAVQLIEYLLFLVMATAVVTWRHSRASYAAVQVHNLPDILVLSAIVPKLTGAAVILDIHDLMPEFFQARTGLGWGHPLVRMVRWEEWLSVRFADHVITVTDGWRQTIEERCGATSVSVVMNLADPEVFDRQARRSDPEDFTIVYHGTFTERYGVLVLVDSVDLLRRRIGRVKLRMLGDGDGRPKVERLIADRDLSDCIELSDGMLSAKEVATVIRDAHVGVVPNLSNVFTDGLLPTKLLEYVAMGIPVVAARTPMVVSYFADDQVAYFEPGDAADLADVLVKLEGDAGLRESYAREANRFNDAHDWPREAARYVELVLGRAGVRP